MFRSVLFTAATLVMSATAADTAPAPSGAADPKVEFLGYCTSNGMSNAYCACITDTIAGVLKPEEIAVYTAYLQLVASGQQDPNTIIQQLTERFKISPKDLGEILQKTGNVVTPETCATAQ